MAIGTGLQSEFYKAENIKSFTGIDLSGGMLRKARQKLSTTLPLANPNLSVMDAQHLTFDDNSFDTVIDTFSLCVISEPDKALKEMARVVKENGIFFCLSTYGH